MTTFWFGVFVGMFIGAALGIIVLALCVAASRGDAHLATVEQEEGSNAPPAL